MVALAVMVWTALVSQAITIPLSNQPPPTPPAGLIAGRVVDGLSSRPVAGAIVSLSGAGSGPTPRAMTNANGYFVFRRLRKGSYALTASRPGYVDGAPGRRRPGGMSAPVEIADGQRVADLVIPIWRHATISGTVIDEAGEPVIGAEITGFQRLRAGRGDRLGRAIVAKTDDRGVYRLASLEPGDYLVAFVWCETSVPLATAQLLRAALSGSSDPAAEQMLRERLTLRPDVAILGSPTAIQVGTAVRDLPPAAPLPAQSDDGVFIYATQFYPGVPSAARATVIAVASGQDRNGVDFALSPTKAVSVSGMLIGPDGAAGNTTLHLVPAGDAIMSDFDTSATMTGQSGDFTFLGVPPGRYTVRALRAPRATPAGADNLTLFAETAVTVGSRDVSNLVVPLQRTARIAGHLEFDGTGERPDAAALKRVSVTLEQADGTRSTIPAVHAGDTGAFTTAGAPPGHYLVRVGATAGWTLKDVMVDGRDISETPLDLGTTDVNNVVVTFTDRPTKIAGRVLARNGAPDGDAIVIASPVDQSPWSDSGLNPRRVKSTHAAPNGSYTITGLPAGEYSVVAIHEDLIPDWQDPRVLGELVRSGSDVRLADADTRSVDLKVVGGGSQ